MLDPEAFTTHRAIVRDEVELAYAHEGVGGDALLLIHGWPETRRIWWRNIAALAAAGFEVVAPDLRGFGDSSLPADGRYDLAAHAQDLIALMRDVLGHESCAVAAGDLGGAVAIDLGLRFPGFVERQCLFNCPLPLLRDDYEAAGLPARLPAEVRVAADYYVRQGREADALSAELRTDAERMGYVAQFYGSRFWAAPGSFTAQDVAFHVAPFADAAHFRASLGNYENAVGTVVPPEPPRFFERVAVPTLALYGPEDHVIPRDFPERCEVVFDELAGPFVVRGAGHFLQWERAEVLNGALRWLIGAR